MKNSVLKELARSWKLQASKLKNDETSRPDDEVQKIYDAEQIAKSCTLEECAQDLETLCELLPDNEGQS